MFKTCEKIRKIREIIQHIYHLSRWFSLPQTFLKFVEKAKADKVLLLSSTRLDRFLASMEYNPELIIKLCIITMFPTGSVLGCTAAQ